MRCPAPGNSSTGPVKNLLLVEDDANQRMSMVELLRDSNVGVTDFGTAEAAIEAIQARRFDCAIIDLGLPDMSGAELIEQIRSIPGSEELPVIVYTGLDLTKADERRLESIASTIIVKGIGSSRKAPERGEPVPAQGRRSDAEDSARPFRSGSSGPARHPCTGARC